MKELSSGPTAESEWRQSWLVVLVAAFAYFVTVTHIFTLGVFVLPIEHEFGWGRAQIYALLAIVSVIAAPLAPAVGYWVDKKGSRGVAIIGMALYCAAIALFGVISSNIWSWYGCSVVLGLTFVLVKPTVWVTAISHRFERSRGLALGLLMVGGGMGQAVFPPVTYALIEALGWRSAYFALGGISAAVTIPLLLLFFRDVSIESRSAKQAAAGELSGFTVQDYFRSSRFYRLMIFAFFLSFSISALSAHFVPILVWKQFSPGAAVSIMGAVGLAGLIGRVCGGWLLDRVHGITVGVITALLPCATCGIFLALNQQSTVIAMAAGLLVGAAAGALIGLLGYLCSRYFGLRNFGFGFGLITAAVTSGLGVGPLFAAAIYDRYQSYDFALIGLVMLLLVGLVLIVTMGKYPGEQSEQTVAQPLEGNVAS